MFRPCSSISATRQEHQWNNSSFSIFFSLSDFVNALNRIYKDLTLIDLLCKFIKKTQCISALRQPKLFQTNCCQYCRMIPGTWVFLLCKHEKYLLYFWFTQLPSACKQLSKLWHDGVRVHTCHGYHSLVPGCVQDNITAIWIMFENHKEVLHGIFTIHTIHRN